VFAAMHDDDAPDDPNPPWPLRRDEVEAFGADGLRPVEIEIADGRWRAEFERP
jgi:hypothetical protein